MYIHICVYIYIYIYIDFWGWGLAVWPLYAHPWRLSWQGHASVIYYVMLCCII